MTKCTTTQKYFLWLQIRGLIVLRFRGAFLGFFWNLLQPALYLFALGGIFSTLNRLSYRDYVIYLFAGLIPWRFFEQATLTMLESIVANSVYTKKIQVPHFYFPAIQLAVAVFDFFCALAIFCLLLVFMQGKFHMPMIILPLAILVWIAIATGTGLVLSVLFVFLRDIKGIVHFGMSLLLFSSGIFFNVQSLSPNEGALRFLRYDPVYYWVALFQKPVYEGHWPLAQDWIVSLASGIGMLCLGILLYRVNKNRFYYAL